MLQRPLLSESMRIEAPATAEHRPHQVQRNLVMDSAEQLAGTVATLISENYVFSANGEAFAALLDMYREGDKKELLKPLF